MATAPVEVKQNTPQTAGGMPDVFRSFRTEMDRLFDQFAAGFGMPSFARMFEALPRPRFTMPSMPAAFTMPSPAMEITESDGAYKLTAELPGLSEKDIEIGLRDDVLTIRGEKKQESEQTKDNVRFSERAYGSFERSFVLPEGIDTDKITAGFSKGVLTLTLPRRPEAESKQKKIEVKAAG